jgi:predicted Zn-ribbon and HTH transcriptional regulator
MKKRENRPVTSHEMHDTIRRGIETELNEGPRSALELSAALRIPEREVYGHLEHVKRTAAAAGRHLVIIPAECRKCGFLFAKRDRFKGPGKCPVCRSEAIHEPLFEIRGKTR